MKISASDIKIYLKADCQMPTSIFDKFDQKLNTVYNHPSLSLPSPKDGEGEGVGERGGRGREGPGK